MGTDNVYGTPKNADSAALTLGMIVRTNTSKTVVRAQADSAPHLQGLCGVVNSGSVAPTGVVNVVCAAFRQPVLLETGLTPAAGQTLYVSATVKGRATNVAPGIAVAFGTIEDVGSYATTGQVFATVSVPASTTVAASISISQGADIIATSNPITGVGTIAFNAPTWSVLGARVFALDGINGDDTFLGYADSANLTSAGIAAATVAAGLVAKKTLAGLMAVVPMNGLGVFSAFIVYRGDGTTYSDSLGLLTKIGSTYLQFNCRGTGTNATAGSTAFAGDAADLSFMGAVTGTGLFAAGYSSTGAVTSNVLTLKQTNGGVPAFAMPNKPEYLRARGDVNNPTIANRNLVVSVVEILAGTQLRLSQNVTVTNVGGPAGTGDIFYIEQPGAAFTGNAALTNVLANIRGAQIVGSASINRSTTTLSFCSVTVSTIFTTPSVANFTNSYTTGTTTVNCGPTRLEGVLFINNGRLGTGANTLGVVGSISATETANFTFVDNCWCGGTISAFGGGGDPSAETGTNNTLIGGQSAALANPARPIRIDGQLVLDGWRGNLAAINLPSTTAASGLVLNGANDVLIRDVISGGLKTDCGVDLTASRASRIIMTGAGSLFSTITGVNGDICAGQNNAAGVPKVYIPWTIQGLGLSFRFPTGDTLMSDVSFPTPNVDPPIIIDMTMAINPGPATITAGLVRGSAPGDAFDVQPLQADTLANASGGVGCAWWTIGVNKTSFVSWGRLAQISWDEGNPGAGGVLAYASPITPGGVASTKPTAVRRVVGWSVGEQTIILTPDNLPSSDAVNGVVTVTMNNAPAGTPAAPVRYVKVADGAGGFYTFPSLS